jgi:hypothetical protein
MNASRGGVSRDREAGFRESRKTIGVFGGEIQPHGGGEEETPAMIPEAGGEAPSSLTGQPCGTNGGKTRGLRARAIIAAAFAVPALVAFAFLAILAARDPVEASERYLSALREGRWGEAWEMLHHTSEFKERGDLEGYMDQARKRMDSVSGWKVHLRHLTGSRAYVDVELFRDGGSGGFRLGLRNDGEGWMVYEPVTERDYGSP